MKWPRTFLSGRISRLEWLSEVGYSGNPGMVRLTRYINGMVESGTIGRNETVFMVAESKGLDLKCRYLPDQRMHPVVDGGDSRRR